MIDIDALRADVARAICEAGNVPGFKCGCPHPLDGYCLGGAMPKNASAAIAAVLEAVAAECDRRMGNRPTAINAYEENRHAGHDNALGSLSFDLGQAAAAARGAG